MKTAEQIREVLSFLETMSPESDGVKLLRWVLGEDRSEALEHALALQEVIDLLRAENANLRAQIPPKFTPRVAM